MAMLYTLKHMHMYTAIQRLYTRFLSLSGRCLGLYRILQINAQRTANQWNGGNAPGRQPLMYIYIIRLVLNGTNFHPHCF